jgi:hypothetical protein
VLQPIWLLFLAANIGLSAVWWWVMPGPQVGALLVMALLVLSLFARGKLSEMLLPAVLAGLVVFWISFAITARIVFFESFQSLWNLPFFGGAIFAALWMRRFRFRVRPVWLTPILAILGALGGATAPDSLRAPLAATVPAGGEVSMAPGKIERKLQKLSRDVQLHPDDARVVIRRDKWILNVGPLLTFADRSLDRFYASKAPTVRTLTATNKGAIAYKDEDASVLEVSAVNGVQIDARSRLASPIYSHDNSFAVLSVQGHRKLTVEFSPSKTRVDVPSVTSPPRFAYVDAAGGFHLVEGDRLKGPWRELTSGALGKNPLSLTLYDGDKPMFVVRFEDWAGQASTQESPTSGLPENLIEMQRASDDEAAPALISLSLASTMIGRGTQSVGHSAGVYRDRISITTP